MFGCFCFPNQALSPTRWLHGEMSKNASDRQIPENARRCCSRDILDAVYPDVLVIRVQRMKRPTVEGWLGCYQRLRLLFNENSPSHEDFYCKCGQRKQQKGL